MSEIVKVQVPLFAFGMAHAGAGPLVYAKRGKDSRHQGISTETARALGSDLKGYFEADLDPATNLWNIGKRVAEQSW